MNTAARVDNGAITAQNSFTIILNADNAIITAKINNKISIISFPSLGQSSIR